VVLTAKDPNYACQFVTANNRKSCRKNLEYMVRQKAKQEAGNRSWKGRRHTDVEAFHPHKAKTRCLSKESKQDIRLKLLVPFHVFSG